jgi:hypothetical protein
MNHRVVLPLLLMLVAAGSAAAQYAEGPRPQPTVVLSPFVGHASAIPGGYSLELSAAYPPYARRTQFAFGSFSLGIEGVFQASFSHEAAFGSPTGMFKPTNLVTVQVQLVPQREQYPSVGLFLAAMVDPQYQYVGPDELSLYRPQTYTQGLSTTSYKFKTTRAGLAANTTLADCLTFDLTLGAIQNVWSQLWSIYSIDPGLPSVQGVTFPLAERSSVFIDWSASVAWRAIPQIAFVGSVSTIPYANVDPTLLTIQAKEGNAGTIGVRYYLPSVLSIDLYDRWYLERGTLPMSHEVRLGLRVQAAYQ